MSNQETKLKDTAKVKELLAKLESMAKFGAESGERDSARRRIDEISAKYGIEKSLWEEKAISRKPIKPKDKFFPCKSMEYKTLLSHCIFDTNPEAKVFDSGGAFGLLANVNDLEYIEVMEKMKHYWRAYVSERNMLLKAFIVKHQIGTVGVSEGDSSAISTIEYNAIKHLASVIVDKPFKAKK